MCQQEPGPCRNVDVISVEFTARRKGEAVDDAIKAIPGIRNTRHQIFNLAVFGDIARINKIRAPLLSKSNDAILQLFVLIGKRQFAPSRRMAAAIPEAIESLLATPRMRIFLFVRKPMYWSLQMCDFRVYVPACVFGIRQGGLPV